MDPRQLTRLLLTCGAVGAPLFVAVFLIDGVTRAGYDPVRQPVSALSLDDRGWLQIANFVVCGVLLLGFAVGLRRATSPGAGSFWGPLLAGAFAVGLILSGAFVMDPVSCYPPGEVATAGAGGAASWHGGLHDLAGIVVFVCLPAASLVLAPWFATAARRPGWAAYSVASGVAGVVLLVAFSVAWESDSAYAGLVQRVTIVTGWTWVTLVALRLLTLRQPTSGQPTSGQPTSGQPTSGQHPPPTPLPHPGDH